MSEQSWTLLDKDFRRLKAIEAAVFYSLGQMDAALKMERTKAGLRGAIEAIAARLEKAVEHRHEGEGVAV